MSKPSSSAICMPARTSRRRGVSSPIPSEVVEQVAEYLEAAGSKRTLANIARTSRTNFQLVAPFLYRHLEVPTRDLHPVLVMSFDDYNAYMLPRSLRAVRMGLQHPAHPSSTIQAGWYLSRIEVLTIQHRHLLHDVPGLGKLASSYSTCVGLEHHDERDALLMPQLERIIVLPDPPNRRRDTQRSEESRECGRDALTRIPPSLCRPRFICGRYPIPRLPKVDQRGQLFDDGDTSVSDGTGMLNLLLQNLPGVQEVIIHDLSYAPLPLCPGAVVRVFLAPEAPDHLISALRNLSGSIAATAYIDRRRKRLDSLESRLLESLGAAGARSHTHHSSCKWELAGVERYLDSSGRGFGGESDTYGSEIESYLLDRLKGPYRLWKSRVKSISDSFRGQIRDCNPQKSAWRTIPGLSRQDRSHSYMSL